MELNFVDTPLKFKNKNRNGRKDYMKLILLYFQYRNSFNFGFQRYGFFKNLIKYITGISNLCYIRSLFDEIKKNGYMEKGIIQESVYYRYNPYKKIDVLPEFIITF